jgi:hypothetical protein
MNADFKQEWPSSEKINVIGANIYLLPQQLTERVGGIAGQADLSLSPFSAPV